MADLPENPNNREEEYLADIAGLPNNVPENPWSRKEAYLAAISGRLDGIDAKIAALATDISLKGGVADYDHLPEDAAIGDAYITEDTGILYVWVGDEWTPLNMQGGSGVITLTSDDYNYPTDNPTYINTYLLDPGYYMIEAGTKVMVYGPSQPTELGQPMTVLVFTRFNNPNSKWILSANNTDGIIVCNGSNGRFYSYVCDDSTASSSGITEQPLSANQGYLINQKLVDSVIRGAGAPTTSTVGKVGTLYEDTTNAKVYICTDATNPYTWTEVGAGGGGGVTTLTSDDYNWPTDNPTSVALWLLNPGYYQADNITVKEDRSDTWNNNKDLWMVGMPNASDQLGILQVGNGAVRAYRTNTNGYDAGNLLGDPILVRNRDIYGDAGQTKIRIGSTASAHGNYSEALGAYATAYGYAGIAIGSSSQTKTTSNYAIAIGQYANADASGSVAIGFESHAAAQGEFNIGCNSTYAGYNNSQYRLISGVYDGQSLHDAATVAQGNTLATSAPTTSTAGVLGQLYTDTTGMHTYQCTAIDTTDPANPSYTWTQRW